MFFEHPVAAATSNAPGRTENTMAKDHRLVSNRMKSVLVIDVGGTHVKLLATGQMKPREIVSGPAFTAKKMVAAVRELTRDWPYEVVAMGYPGPVLHNRPVVEP